MSLSERGEGGTIVLKNVLVSMMHNGKWKGLVTFLSLAGITLLLGDGVITPAISILSAVEGSIFIPGFENLSVTTIVLISIIISIGLFSFQRFGTEKIASSFGPIMVIWFISLSLVGVVSIIQHPIILKALFPYYGIDFLLHHGWIGFFLLGEVILCATGGEALYADMGHLGAKPIRNAWLFVFIALVLNYLGQGAFLISKPETRNILFEMFNSHFQILYIPFLILAITATIIASQAMISGVYSIVYQAINTGILPLLKINYTSTERISQIYISIINWLLMIAVIIVMLGFQESSKLASAYGLAVTGTMTITGIFMVWIFTIKQKYLNLGFSIFVLFIDVLFFGANLYKIPHGGFWSIIIALFPLTIILIYTHGNKKLYRSLPFTNSEEFTIRFKEQFNSSVKIKGTAMFLVRDYKLIPPYIIQTMFNQGIIYEDNILLSLKKSSRPYGVIYQFREDITTGLRFFEISSGYMEVLNIEQIISEIGTGIRVIFYGVEDIRARYFIWKTYSLFKQITPKFIQFYNFPSHLTHGIITKVDLK